MGTIGRTARMGAGLALGAATAAAHVLLLLPAAIALLVPAARPAVATVPGRLAGIERTRVTTTLGGATEGNWDIGRVLIASNPRNTMITEMTIANAGR